jgi:enoyl-CoA hydratase/carnithine racemase
MASSRAEVRSRIAVERTAAELADELAWAERRADLVGAGAVVLRLAPDDPPLEAVGAAALASLPVVVVASAADPATVAGPWLDVVDVVLAGDDDSLDDVLGTVERHPLASVAYALLLRDAERRSTAAGLVAESATYSMLQGGPELAAWRAQRPRRERPAPTGEVVRVTRHDDELVVTLDRPEVRNALSSQLRDELLAAVEVALADGSIRSVELRGAGPAFCAGGDLDEFGSFADPASAHVVRLEHSIGRALAALGDRLTAYVHGACYGSGIELPAFAPVVVADPATRFALPELGLGLVPGAGGTVSITGRIGRHRTAWLGLSGREIDATTASAWGLVDRVEPVAPAPGHGPVGVSKPDASRSKV